MNQSTMQSRRKGDNDWQTDQHQNMQPNCGRWRDGKQSVRQKEHTMWERIDCVLLQSNKVIKNN